MKSEVPRKFPGSSREVPRKFPWHAVKSEVPGKVQFDYEKRSSPGSSREFRFDCEKRTSQEVRIDCEKRSFWEVRFDCENNFLLIAFKFTTAYSEIWQCP